MADDPRKHLQPERGGKFHVTMHLLILVVRALACWLCMDACALQDARLHELITGLGEQWGANFGIGMHEQWRFSWSLSYGQRCALDTIWGWVCKWIIYFCWVCCEMVNLSLYRCCRSTSTHTLIVCVIVAISSFFHMWIPHCCHLFSPGRKWKVWYSASDSTWSATEQV